MDTCTEKIQALARDLLEKGTVEKVIGFSRGSIPMSSRPVMIGSAQQADQLVFDSLCGLNLANFARGLKEKTAVVAKGCDARNLVNHMVENQINKDNLYVIGVPCHGMVDRFKISGLFENEIIEFKEEGQQLTVASAARTLTLDKKDYLRHNCQYCTHRNPVIYDTLAGDLVEEQELDAPFEDVDRIEALSAEDRWAHFQNLTKNCIRCYACRNACPLCYCPTCFVDESGPQWVGKGCDKTDVDTFHFLRAFHCAGRCTDCGACAEACPMAINVRDFTRKLNKDALELFGWEAGMKEGQRPPLDAFSPDDPNDFIK